MFIIFKIIQKAVGKLICNPQEENFIQEAAEEMVDYYKYTQWSDITDFEETVLSFMGAVYGYLDWDNNLGDYQDERMY